MKTAWLLMFLVPLVLVVTYFVNRQNLQQDAPTEPVRITHGPDYDKPALGVSRPSAVPAPPSALQTLAEPSVEAPEIATPDELHKFPAIYHHRRIHLIGWGDGLMWNAHDLKPHQTECDALGLDTVSPNYTFTGIRACIDDIPAQQLSDLLLPSNVNRTIEWNRASEKDVDLVCTLDHCPNEAQCVLTHCALSKSRYRKAKEAMEERERQLEQQGTDWKTSNE